MDDLFRGERISWVIGEAQRCAHFDRPWGCFRRKIEDAGREARDIVGAPALHRDEFADGLDCRWRIHPPVEMRRTIRNNFIVDCFWRLRGEDHAQPIFARLRGEGEAALLAGRRLL